MVVSLLDLVEPSTLWYGKLRLRRAGVAQSVEQRFCKPQVGGSIPLASSISSKEFTDFRSLLYFQHAGSCAGTLRNLVRFCQG